MKQFHSIVFACVSLLFIGQAQAALTTYTFSGNISSSDTVLQALYGDGSAFSGTFTLDDAAIGTASGGGGMNYFNSFSGHLDFASHSLQFNSGMSQVMNNAPSPGTVSLPAGEFWNSTIQSTANVDGFALVALNIRLGLNHPFDASLPMPTGALIGDPNSGLTTQLGIVYWNGGSGPLSYVFADITNVSVSAVPEPGVLWMKLVGALALFARRKTGADDTWSKPPSATRSPD